MTRFEYLWFVPALKSLLFFLYALVIKKGRDADYRFLAQDLETLYILEMLAYPFLKRNRNKLSK